MCRKNSEWHVDLLCIRSMLTEKRTEFYPWNESRYFLFFSAKPELPINYHHFSCFKLNLVFCQVEKKESVQKVYKISLNCNDLVSAGGCVLSQKSCQISDQRLTKSPSGGKEAFTCTSTGVSQNWPSNPKGHWQYAEMTRSLMPGSVAEAFSSVFSASNGMVQTPWCWHCNVWQSSSSTRQSSTSRPSRASPEDSLV